MSLPQKAYQEILDMYFHDASDLKDFAMDIRNYPGLRRVERAEIARRVERRKSKEYHGYFPERRPLANRLEYEILQYHKEVGDHELHYSIPYTLGGGTSAMVHTLHEVARQRNDALRNYGYTSEVKAHHHV